MQSSRMPAVLGASTAVLMVLASAAALRLGNNPGSSVSSRDDAHLNRPSADLADPSTSTRPTTTTTSLHQRPEPPCDGYPSTAPPGAAEGTWTASTDRLEVVGRIATEDLHLGGSVAFSYRGDVIDAAGREHRDVSLEVRGSDVLIEGRATIEAGFTLGPGPDVALRDPVSEDLSPLVPSASSRLVLDGPVSITADDLRIGHPFGFTDPSDLTAVAGPVRLVPTDFVAFDGQLYRSPVLKDLPNPLVIRDVGVTWAGTGRVEHAGTVYEHRYFAVTSSEMSIGWGDDGSGTVAAEGSGKLRQIWIAGLPQLATVAAIDPPTRTVTAAAGDEVRFVWSPENRGPHDLTIACMVPVSPADPASPSTHARSWVETRLAPLPRLYGGHDGPEVGGHSRFQDHGTPLPFLGGGTASLPSLLAPGQQEGRDVSIHVPPFVSPGAYPIEIEIQGNFAPVRLLIDLRVTAS